ncbi:uncharacterized protein PHALS_10929 [Plasmopara halstedii]|uniref:Uncharacterized protein n=1 Tax=Plasmopara halstedii TaxID=4781 RepID=A0A0P1AIA5_PLAHL|nr:uncharacterized protein PHALS_10929 [Plasmopara halstedii]CEG40745.1 hypothetical protein PHALS_10929 [Plasmopara halstedii]|eukprot:XP_024577114.1 hypothetical protein PHALS_10929 [Plasmopara halstedii]
MAGSMGSDVHDYIPESPRRGNVQGLVTYYDALGVVKEAQITLSTSTVPIVRGEPVVDGSELQEKRSQQQREQGRHEQEQAEEDKLQKAEETKDQVINQLSNQDTSDMESLLPKFQEYSLPLSRIPPPKSREDHRAASSVCKPSPESAPHVRMSYTVVADITQPLFVPPPTPVSARIRGPRTSYAAFATRIENSSSRLLDFERDVRWLGQVEAMKCRVETLKRRNQIALAKEVASAPRRSRSMSECSGVSTASTASMSSMDLPEINCQ